MKYLSGQQTVTDSIQTQAEWERLRREALDDPGRFHGDIAKREIHWFVPKAKAWCRLESSGWRCFSSVDGGELSTIGLSETFEPWTKGFDPSEAPYYRWFSGGFTNACFNEVDANVLSGHGDETAFVFEYEAWSGEGLDGAPPYTRTVSRQSLFEEVAKCSLVLKDLGLRKGDRIAFYLPNSPEHIFLIEAAKRLGVIYTCVFGGLSAKALAERVVDTGAKLVITCDRFRRNGVIVRAKSDFVDVALDQFIKTTDLCDILDETLSANLDIAAKIIKDDLYKEISDRFVDEFVVSKQELAHSITEYLESRGHLDSNRKQETIDTIGGAIPRRSGLGVQAVLVLKGTNDAEKQTYLARDLDFEELLRAAAARLPAPASGTSRSWIEKIYQLVPPEPVEADFPLFIAYTSGSTGKPKGVVHTHGGYVAGLAHTMKVVFAAEPGVDSIHCIADPGWITGQSYMICAPLVRRITSIITEGGPSFPFPTRFASVLSRHRVTILKAGSTFLRSVAADPQCVDELKQYDLSKLKVASFCAEPVSPSIQKFGMENLTRRYINSYWATEHGGIILSHFANSEEFPLSPDAHCFPLPWIFAEVRIAQETPHSPDESRAEFRLAEPTEKGEIVITRPYPYLARTIWGDAERVTAPDWKGDLERFSKTYLERWSVNQQDDFAYTQGDFSCAYEDGSFTLHGRSDEVINTSGHRIGTEEIESAILKDKILRENSPVANVIVVGAPHEERGTVPLAFILTNPGMEFSPEDEVRLSALIASEKGEIAIPAGYLAVSQFPETRSGKYMRRYLKALLNNDELGDVSTLRNPESIDELATVIHSWNTRKAVLNTASLPESQLPPDSASLTRQLIGITLEDQRRILSAVIRREIRLQLGANREMEIGPDAQLMLLGINSLTAIKLRNRLKLAILGADAQTPPPNLVFSHPTVEKLTDFFTNAIKPEVHGKGKGESGASDPAVEADNRIELCPSVFPDRRTPYHWQIPKNVLLTGATGYLGAFVLEQLLKETDANIFCLVRSSANDPALSRIDRTLQSYDIYMPSGNRLTAVAGDLAEPSFGLSERQYAALSERIDAIYHAGALVNHVFPYSTLRQTNVLGTEEILKFSVRGRLKIVHNISSIGVFLGAAHAEKFVTEWSFPESMTGLIDGYCQSKWAAERLCRSASLRGVPVVNYRPGAVSWNSVSGAFNPADFVVNLLRVCVTIGLAPALNIPFDLAPVEQVSRAIVRISLDPASVAQTFALSNPRIIHLPEVISLLNSAGFSIRTVPLRQWLSELESSDLRDDRFAISCRSYYLDADENPLGQFAEAPMPVFDTTNTKRLLRITGHTYEEIGAPYVQLLMRRLGFSPASRSSQERKAA